MKDLTGDLIAKGYRPLPVQKGRKFCHIKGWPELVLEPFDAPGVGLNLDGCAMVDIDVEDVETADALLALVPSNPPFRFRRNSGRLAALFRSDVDHRRLSTAKYRDEEEADARVEIKMGKGEFLFGWGLHPTGVELEWDPETLPAHADLPFLSLEEAEALLERFEKELLGRYGSPIAPGVSVEGATTAHDLTWDMHFEGAGTLRELVDAGCDEWVNLTPWRPDSDSQAGHLFWGSEVDGPVLYDFVTHTKHFMASDQDPDGEDIDYEALADARGLLQPTDATQQALGKQDEAVYTAFEVNEWRQQFVWVDSEERFYSTKDPDMAPKSRMVMKRALGGMKEGFEKVFQNWERVADQLVWDPSEPPSSIVTRLDGRTELNTYREVTFPPGGTAEPFFRFLETFVPDEYGREVLLDWMALKVQEPSRRLFAVVLLGPQGSGKSMFASIFGDLFRPAYVNRSVLSVLLEGRYDDALHNTLLCVVDEADSGSRRDRDARFRVLREKVDPEAREMKLNIKGQKMVRQKVFTTFLFCTNDADALPLEGDQRRFCVLQTGPELSPVDAKALADWKASEANLGALKRFLKEREPRVNPYVAPMTEAKEQMGLANRTEVDDLADGFLEIVAECGGWYIAPQAKQFAVQQGLHDNNRLDVFMAKLRKATVAPFGRVKNKVRIAGGTPQPLRSLRGSTSRSTFDVARASMRALQSHLDAPVTEELEK